MQTVLYVFRHGKAVEIGEDGAKSDADRKLSAEGRGKTKAVVAGLKEIGCRPDRIFSSPLVRAVETAEIAAAGLGRGLRVEEDDRLMPGAPVSGVISWLGSVSRGAVMIVGHMPDLAALAASLIGGDPAAGIDLKKASICRIAFPGRISAGAGVMEWLIPPSILLCLGK